MIPLIGSTRQLTDSTGTVTLAKSYDPYGTVTHTSGAAQSAYGFTGEMADVSGLTYLRARDVLRIKFEYHRAGRARS